MTSPYVAGLQSVSSRQRSTCMTIPVKPGRNLAVIIEVAAMNNRQKRMGYNAAKELLKRLGMPADSDSQSEDWGV